MHRAYANRRRREQKICEAKGMERYYLEKADLPRFVGILLVIGALLGVGIGAIVFSGSQTTITQRVTVTNMITSLQQIIVTQTQFTTIVNTQYVTATQTAPQTSAATIATGWREIKRFTGNADTTTEPFNVPSTTWRIRWSYSSPQATSFSFFVYKVDQTAYVEAVSSYATGASSATYINKGQANFYLSITTLANYEIIIETPS